MKKILPLSLFLLLISFTGVKAAGVSLSSTQIGTTATLSSTIPTNACSTNKMGESKVETVSGFSISTFSLNENGTMVGNLAYINLSQATVRQLTISGRAITNFKPSTRDFQPRNSADIIKTQRNFDFDSPLVFNPTDSATLILDNVKIEQAGPVKAVFAFTYQNGISTPCLHSGWTTINVGQAPVQKLTATTAPKLSPSAIFSTPSPIPSPLPSSSTISASDSTTSYLNSGGFLRILFSQIFNFISRLFK